MARLLSVNVGLPRDVTWNCKTVRNAVWKSPVTGRRMVRKLDLDGDAQADLAGHGGEHRDVVLDVPQDSTGISFGILLFGAGQVWLNNTKFDVVGSYTPVTKFQNNRIPEKPVNLDFAE